MFVDAQYSARNGASTFVDAQYSTRNGTSTFIDAQYYKADGAPTFADTQHSQVNGASTFSDAPLSFPWLHSAMHIDVILTLRNRLLWGLRKNFGRFLIFFLRCLKKINKQFGETKNTLYLCSTFYCV